MQEEKKFVIIALICGFAALGGILGYASMGYVRVFNIFWPEEVRQTLEFRNVDGKTVVVGTVGNAGTNPDLIMRTGAFTYILTVKNADSVPHLLYVEGIDKSTKMLNPGDSDKISFKSNEETTFNYYDLADGKTLLGTIRATNVVPLDAFEGENP